MVIQKFALALGVAWLVLQVKLLIDKGGDFWPVVAAATTLAALPVLIETVWSKQKLMSVLFMGLFVLLLGYTMPSAIERASAKLDGVLQSRANLELLAADKAAECKTGRGPNCRRLEAELRAARAIAPTLSATPRLARLTGIEEETLNAYLPLAFPLANEMAVWLLIWMGLSPSLSPKKRKSTRRKPIERQLPLRLA